MNKELAFERKKEKDFYVNLHLFFCFMPLNLRQSTESLKRLHTVVWLLIGPERVIFDIVPV